MPLVAKGAPVVRAVPVGDSLSVEIGRGIPPFTVSVRGLSQTKRSRTFAFMGVGPGPHVVRAVDGSGLLSELEVVVP